MAEPPDPTRPEPGKSEEMSAQSNWLRALALELAGDPHLADDLAQETMRVALERAPEKVNSPRAWLARVLKNLFLQHLRAESRRWGRELEAFRRRGGVAGSRAPELEEDEVARLHAAIRALPRLQCEAILLRYEAGLPPREIAARLGVPVKTVNARLHRALVRLRSELAAMPPRRRRLEALISLRLPRRWRASASWAAPAAVVCAGMVVVTAVFLVAPRAHPGSPPAVVSRLAGGTELASSAESIGRRRVVVPTPEASLEADELERSSGVLLEGRVVTVDGLPAAGATVRLERYVHDAALSEGLVHEPDTVATADDGGWFRLPLPGGEPPHYLRAVAERPGEVPILGTYVVDGQVDGHRILVLAPAVRREGIVRDSAGRPIAGAHVLVTWPAHVESVSLPLVRPARITRDARSGADGTFRFDALPLVPGAVVKVGRSGYRPAAVALEAAEERLEIALARNPDVRVVSGRVLGADGFPVARAAVLAGERMAETDASGAFELAFLADAEVHELAAGAQGYAPVRQPLPGGTEHLEIVLDRQDLAIEGRVEDEDGRAVAGVLVWPFDPERVPWLPADAPPAAMESLSAGESWPDRPTDAEGSFRLSGLLPRAYRLRAVHPGDLAGAETRPIEAGRTGVVVRLERRSAPGIHGTLRTSDGAPLEGAFVRPAVEMWSWPVPIGADPAEFRRLPTARSDVEGAFGFAGARHPTRLEVSAEGILTRIVEAVPGESLEIALERSRLIEVELRPDAAGAAGDARLLVLDGAGEPLRLHHSAVYAWSSVEAVALAPGRRQQIHVPDSAATVRLELGEETTLARELPAGREPLVLLLP